MEGAVLSHVSGAHGPSVLLEAFEVAIKPSGIFTRSLWISFQSKKNTNLASIKVILIVLAKCQLSRQRRQPVQWQACRRRFSQQQNDS